VIASAGETLVRRRRSAGRRAADQVSAEIMKITTTGTWLWLLLGVVLFTALALWTNGVSHHFTLHPDLSSMGAEARAQAVAQAAQSRSPAGQVAIAANMITSGQFLGVLFAMLLGVLVVTSETAHHTATVTFLTTPRRSAVIAAKLLAAACFGALFWLVSTAMTAIATPVYLSSQHLTVSVTDWVVTRSVLLNLLVYVLWACFGLGLGAMVDSQLGAVITGIGSYLAGLAVVEVLFHALYSVYHHGWVLGASVIAPAVASTVAITPGRAFAHAPPQWAGVLVLAGYAGALTAAGMLRTSRRDVS
jgi:ABC-2 type transport system permease protein